MNTDHSQFETVELTTDVPCVQGRFGKNLATYSTQLTLKMLMKVLGHDPRSRYWKSLPAHVRVMYESVQRSTSKGRRDGVAAYIEDRLSRNQYAAFPALSIGVNGGVFFEPFANAPKGAGWLKITDEASLFVLDGLGRLTGALDLRESGPAGATLVEQIVFPVTFYGPMPGQDDLDVKVHGQLFSDFNFRVNPVPAQLAIALDQSDIYIALTNDIAKEPFITANGGMELRAKSLGGKSTALVTQAMLLRTVRGACEGRDFQESNLALPASPNLTDATKDVEKEIIASFFTELSQRMGTARWTDKSSIHLSSPGWQALGVICNDMNHRGLDIPHDQYLTMIEVIAQIDWSRKNEEWATTAKLGVMEAGELAIRGAGRNNTQAIIDFLRAKTGLAEKLAAHKASESVGSNPALVA